MKKVTCLILFLLLMTTACKARLKAPEGYSVFEVESKPMVSELYFTSTVQPLKSVSITSPVEGAIEKKNFEYGQAVKVGTLLFLIRSNQLEKDYREAIASYLKSKTQYETNKRKLEDDEALKKEDIISENEYRTTQTSYSDAYISYLQSEQAVKQIFEKAQVKMENVKALMASDREAVAKVLLADFNVLEIKASESGVALLPEKAASNEGESLGGEKLTIGSAVKAGQALVYIGDMTGIRLTVPVNQIDINSIKPGQKATISSDGFPGLVLQGQVVDVSAQAVQSTGNGLPTFPAHVEVKNIQEFDRKKIAVGMRALVRVWIEYPQKIMVPIKAVNVSADKKTVKMFNRKNNKLMDVSVTTGQTTAQDVEIMQGLLPGDHILVRR
ncbi:MAG: hypothetical protein A3I12_01830 [Gammaproteobacteria bacterium RIFCSPLOWO2_02_FULL_38_11]|nr:MAG: hypothetical protein A3I12_01830 [Gammaproteobacteria bacterium RIFCSPLOWO2_02_FULL_38_11]